MGKAKTYQKTLLLFLVGIVVWLYCGSKDIFKDGYSTVVFSKEEVLIGAHIASDEQWRFPMIDSLPPSYKAAVLTYEDKRFYSHPGVDLSAIVRAVIQNLKAGKVKSGASTLTMQTIRLSRKGKARNVWQKMIETALAIRLELHADKEEILKMYASHAPFGGNVVGLEAASWRYFQKAPNYLSLAESAMLAVLPNAPSLIHISKNRDLLRKKRDELLRKMCANKTIDSLSMELALLENIPPRPFALPKTAPHLTAYLSGMVDEKARFNTTIDFNIQNRTNEIARFYHDLYSQSGIHNLGILVMDTWSGEVRAYIGNADQTQKEQDVDMIHAKRSTGSILKPFLYGLMLDDGEITPEQWLLDVPLNINGFRPRNYDRSFRGVVSAKDALAQSLNIPMVSMLRTYKGERFLRRLRQLGFTSFNQDADHYGLSLILGGGEVNLWELTGAYASMGRILSRFNKDQSRYSESDIISPSLTKRTNTKSIGFKPSVLSAGAIYHAFEAMKTVKRPDQEGAWQSFNSRGPIAWKTGTSYGHRDAWAVGVTERYTVGVWVGNADGEGVNGLIGVQKAAPILFDVFNSLPNDSYFEQPLDDLYEAIICSQTGHIAGNSCYNIDTVLMVGAATKTLPCSYHQTVFVDSDGLQGYKGCSTGELTKRSWLLLPPTVAYYYKKRHVDYKKLPSFNASCKESDAKDIVDIIYPDKDAEIYIPIDIDEKAEHLIVKAAHRDSGARLFWHLNDSYLGETEDFHSMSISIGPGNHILRVLDREGNSTDRKFTIIGVSE